MTWRFPKQPVLPATVVDFSRMTHDMRLSPGEERVDTLANVQLSPGDWTVYVIRQLWDERVDPLVGVPYTPTMVMDVQASAGEDRASSTQSVMTEDVSIGGLGRAAYGTRRRCQVFHFHGDTVGLYVRWRSSGYASAQPVPPLDRLVCWISPGRPQRYGIPFDIPRRVPAIFEEGDPWQVPFPEPLAVPPWAVSWQLSEAAFDAPANLWVPQAAVAAWSEYRLWPALSNVPLLRYQMASAMYQLYGSNDVTGIVGEQAVPVDARYMWALANEVDPSPNTDVFQMSGIFWCYG